MKIVLEAPPNFKRINEVFDVRGKPILFAYGDTIFNPEGVEVLPELRAHENVHRLQQGDNPDLWWEQYLTDRSFRLSQETPAHVAELIAMRPFNRATRRKMAAHVASKLAAPLYGRLIEKEEAKRLLLDELKSLRAK